MDYVHVLFDDQAPATLHNLCMAERGERAAIDDIAKECGQRLKECREQRKWTQVQLSEATGYRVRRGGLSPSQIGNFEQGTRRIGFEEAHILASVFTEYPAAYFMGLVDKREAQMLAVLRKGTAPVPKVG